MTKEFGKIIVEARAEVFLLGIIRDRHFLSLYLGPVSIMIPRRSDELYDSWKDKAENG